MVRAYQLVGILPKTQSRDFCVRKSTFKLEKIEKLKELHKNTNWDDVEYNGWKLPATKPKKETCGNWKSKGCLNISNHPVKMAWIKHYQECCFRAECGVCMWKWLDREANKVATRLEKCNNFANELFGNGFRYKPIHVVVSVPKKDYDLDFAKMKVKAVKLLKIVSVYGGVIIFHPFRFDKEKNEWYYSPHFHIVGYGWTIQTDQVFDKTGYFIKNIGVRDSVFSTVWYQLSHCGIKKGNVHNIHSVIWWGMLGYRSQYSKLFNPEKDDSIDLCPYCCHKLLDLTWVGKDRPPPREEIEFLDDPEGWKYTLKVEEENYQKENPDRKKPNWVRLH